MEGAFGICGEVGGLQWWWEGCPTPAGESHTPAAPQQVAPLPERALSLLLRVHCYLGCPPGDPHMEGVVTADLGVGQPPALLVSLHEGGLLVRQDVADDHGGPSNQRCLRKMGKAASLLLFSHPSF